MNILERHIAIVQSRDDDIGGLSETPTVNVSSRREALRRLRSRVPVTRDVGDEGRRLFEGIAP